MTEANKFSASALNNEQLLLGLDNLVKSERKLMHIILAYIHEVEVRKLHLDLGYDSIFKFLTNHHGYSEDAAYARMQGARLLAQVPALQEKLEQGSLSLTQISKVTSAIRAEKKTGNIVTEQQTMDLLEKIENKNLMETRKIIAVELDQPLTEAQSVKPQKDESFVIQATLTKEQYEAFRKAQSFISHSVPDGSIAGAVAHLSNLLIKKVEGKARQKADVAAEASAPRRSQPSERKATQSFRVIRKRRKHLSLKVRRQLMEECKGHCSFENPETGVTCDSNYQLQADHIIPLSEGGSDDISNLRMMCAIHNRDRHRVRMAADSQCD